MHVALHGNGVTYRNAYLVHATENHGQTLFDLIKAPASLFRYDGGIFCCDAKCQGRRNVNARQAGVGFSLEFIFEQNRSSRGSFVR